MAPRRRKVPSRIVTDGDRHAADGFGCDAFSPRCSGDAEDDEHRAGVRSRSPQSIVSNDPGSVYSPTHAMSPAAASSFSPRSTTVSDVSAADDGRDPFASPPMSPSMSPCCSMRSNGVEETFSSSPASVVPDFDDQFSPNSIVTEADDGHPLSPGPNVPGGGPSSPASVVPGRGPASPSSPASPAASMGGRVVSVKSLLCDSSDDDDGEDMEDGENEKDEDEEEEEEDEDEDDDEDSIAKMERAARKTAAREETARKKAEAKRKVKEEAAKRKAKEEAAAKRRAVAKAKAKQRKKKKVSFIEENPTPLSSQEFSPRSLEPMISPRGDDEETLTLDGADDEEAWRDEEDEWTDAHDGDDRDDNGDERGLLSRAARRSFKAGITPRRVRRRDATPEPPALIDVPDDDSEASLMVLMRYMGCTPVAYGQGGPKPGPGARWLEDGDDASGEGSTPYSTPSGKEFVFESFDDDNSLLSDDGDDEYDEDSRSTYASRRERQERQQDGLGTAWTFNEEGVEMGLDDLVPMSPKSACSARSPASQAPTPAPLERTREKAKKRKTKKGRKPKRDEDEKEGDGNEGGNKKKKPNLTVDVSRKKGRGRKKKGAAGTPDSNTRIMSDEELEDFLSGDGPKRATRKKEAAAPESSGSERSFSCDDDEPESSGSERSFFFSDDEPADELPSDGEPGDDQADEEEVAEKVAVKTARGKKTSSSSGTKPKKKSAKKSKMPDEGKRTAKPSADEDPAEQAGDGEHAKRAAAKKAASEKAAAKKAIKSAKKAEPKESVDELSSNQGPDQAEEKEDTERAAGKKAIKTAKMAVPNESPDEFPSSDEEPPQADEEEAVERVAVKGADAKKTAAKKNAIKADKEATAEESADVLSIVTEPDHAIEKYDTKRAAAERTVSKKAATQKVAAKKKTIKSANEAAAEESADVPSLEEESDRVDENKEAKRAAAKRAAANEVIKSAKEAAPEESAYVLSTEEEPDQAEEKDDANKTAPKKAAANKTAAKRSTAKKGAAKKGAAKKGATKRAAAKKAAKKAIKSAKEAATEESANVLLSGEERDQARDKAGIKRAPAKKVALKISIRSAKDMPSSGEEPGQTEEGENTDENTKRTPAAKSGKKNDASVPHTKLKPEKVPSPSRKRVKEVAAASSLSHKYTASSDKEASFASFALKKYRKEGSSKPRPLGRSDNKAPGPDKGRNDNTDATSQNITASKSYERPLSTKSSKAALERYRKESKGSTPKAAAARTVANLATTPRSSAGTPRAAAADKKAATTADKSGKKASAAGTNKSEKSIVARPSPSSSRKKEKDVAASSPSRREQEKVATSLLNKKGIALLERKDRIVAAAKAIVADAKTPKSTKKVSPEAQAEAVEVFHEDRPASGKCSSRSKQEPPSSTKSKNSAIVPTVSKAFKLVVSNTPPASPTPPASSKIIGTYLAGTPRAIGGSASWDDKASMISGLSETESFTAFPLMKFFSSRSPPPVLSNPKSVIRPTAPVVAPVVNAVGETVSSGDQSVPEKEDAAAVAAAAYAMVASAMAAAEASVAKSAVMSPSAASAASIAKSKFKFTTPPSNNKKDDDSMTTMVTNAMSTAEALISPSAACAASVTKSKFTTPPSNNKKDDSITMQVGGIGKLEQSPSTCSDKENSSSEISLSANRTPPLLTVDTALASAASVSQLQQPVPSASGGSSSSGGSSISQQQLLPLSPATKSVRDMDALLTKTRRWLVHHNEDLQKTKYPTALSTAASSERKVTGNITAKTVLKPKNGQSGSGIGNGKPFSPASKGLSSPTSLMDQLMLSRSNSNFGNTAANTIIGTSILSSASSESMAGPNNNKSILEQLGEIRAKQREIELRQKSAKH